MDDTLVCPICGKKLRNSKIAGSTSLFYKVGTYDDYTERLCTGPNHTIQLYLNETTEAVDLIRLSLDPKYSRFIDIDFLNQKCTIMCVKNSVPEFIEIDKMIDPDFPDLAKLKEKVSLYVTFS